MHTIPYESYQEILLADDFEQLKQSVQSIVKQLGFDGFLYLMVTEQGAPGTDPKTFVLSSYDPEFVKHYQAHHCYRFDPAAIHIRQHQYPIHWGRSSFTGTRAEKMYQTARRYGVRSGATFPVIPPSITIAGFGYARDQEIEHSLPDILRSMPFGQLLATFTHNAINRLLNLYPAPLLTEITTRERACLNLAAQGFRDDEIAAQLGISPRTVLFHLKNARYKLQAVNRPQMIARAMALKVIGI